MARETYGGLRSMIFASGVEVFRVEEQMGKPRSWLSRALSADPEGMPSAQFRESVLSAMERARG